VSENNPRPRRKAAAPPPDSDAAYLLSKGWRPESDPAAGPTRWFCPLAPAADAYDRVRVGERKLPGGRREPVYQTWITPAAWPLTEAEAVALQRGRDAEGGDGRME
jgi:hypothetical protein